jgi:hypothetical protein
MREKTTAPSFVRHYQRRVQATAERKSRPRQLVKEHNILFPLSDPVAALCQTHRSGVFGRWAGTGQKKNRSVS